MNRSLRSRLAKLEAPLAGPTTAEIEEHATFLLMLHRRFKRYPRPQGEEAAMQLLESATTFEERRAAVEAHDEACRLSPYYGMTPAEVLSSRHKPFLCKEDVA